MVLKFALLIAFIFVACRSFAYVRNVYPKKDEILLIRTAIGIATIIQVPEAIESAIIGDASAYKVEYLNDAVTIKPLRYGARTNLYLVTKSVRYNLRLVAVKQSDADYVVYVKGWVRARPIRWMAVRLTSRNYGGKLTVSRVGHTPGGFLLIDGNYLSSDPVIATSNESSINSNNDLSIKPKDFWVFQKTAAVPIDTLYLSNAKLAHEKPIAWSVSINAGSIQSHRPLLIEVKGLHSVRVTIPARYLWH